MRYLSGRVAGKRIDEDQECPFWVKSRHFAVQSRCPLYPRPCQKRLLLRNFGSTAYRFGGGDADNKVTLRATLPSTLREGNVCFGPKVRDLSKWLVICMMKLAG